MKPAEQWMEEINHEASFGEPSMPLIDRIREIQNDAILGVRTTPELMLKNDELECRNQEMERFLMKCIEVDGKIVPTNHLSPQCIALAQSCGCFIGTPCGFGLVILYNKPAK